MTYLGAAGRADEAARAASAARSTYQDAADQQLADAVVKLAEAVAELARSANRTK